MHWALTRREIDTRPRTWSDSPLEGGGGICPQRGHHMCRVACTERLHTSGAMACPAGGSGCVLAEALRWADAHMRGCWSGSWSAVLKTVQQCQWRTRHASWSHYYLYQSVIYARGVFVQRLLGLQRIFGVVVCHEADPAQPE
jgi:hypothetical protein